MGKKKRLIIGFEPIIFKSQLNILPLNYISQNLILINIKILLNTL